MSEVPGVIQKFDHERFEGDTCKCFYEEGDSCFSENDVSG